MTQNISYFDLERYVDGECSDQQAQQIEQAAATDVAIANRIDELTRLRDALRAHATHASASMSLRSAIGESFGSDSAQFAARRRWLMGAGGALAASVAGVSSYLLLRDRNPLGDVAGTFIQDFETYLLKDRALDIRETDLLKIAQWYQSRLPFSLPPVGSSGGGASLVGGRLCWLLERRLASLSYESGNGPIVLYITQAQGIELPAGGDNARIGKDVSWHRSARSSSVIWRSGDLLLAMVGNQEVSKLMAVAESITP